MTANGWISVKDRLPEDEKPVLAVKETKNGTRSLTLAFCILDHTYFDPETKTRKTEPYWVCGGNNNILYWMPLPDMPATD